MRRIHASGLLFVVVAVLMVAGCGRCNRCRGAEPDPSTRVRVALALSAVPIGVEDHGCGVCLPEDTARARARKAGVPLVLFVGGCSGRAKDVIAGTSAVAGRTARYIGDGETAPGDPARTRIVVLSPAEDGWRIHATLPADATPGQVQTAFPVKIVPVTTRVDWQVMAPVYTAPVACAT